jgi:hypothetical protein
MMWIGGVSPADVLHAYVGAGVAIVMCGLVATYQQQRLRPITHTKKSSRIDGGRLLIVVGILVSAFLANLLFDFPAIGVWLAILVGAIFRTTHWPELRQSLKGSVFLVALVWCASLMPVNSLPDGSVLSVFVMGFLSAVSGSITLTKLALDQGGYDWGYVAYAAGYGGSMIWFGSSAGVALINLFPKGRSVGLWMKNGWHVTVSYIVGFTVMLALLGWHPQEKEMPKSVDLSVGK